MEHVHPSNIHSQTGPRAVLSLFLPTQVHLSFVDLAIALHHPGQSSLDTTSNPRPLARVHPSSPLLLTFALFAVPSLHVSLMESHAPFPSLRCPSNSVPPTGLSSCIAVIRCLALPRTAFPVCCDVIGCRMRILRARLFLSGPHSSHPYHYRPWHFISTFTLLFIGPHVFRLLRCWIGFAVSGCESRRVPLFLLSSPRRHGQYRSRVSTVVELDPVG
ncbi:hypothetical protein B0H13DRAFT_2337856 [Mycena leptocephala]|nr:hypothetical protein B0H13DRAFT_2337856 [Mycena leptocephala]